MEEQSCEGQSSEEERQSGDEQLAGDAEQRQAGPTGPETHIIENELAEGQLGMPQLFRGSESFIIILHRAPWAGRKAFCQRKRVHCYAELMITSSINN